MKKIALSACLLGKKCRYDATDNRDDRLLALLKEAEIIPFCPEDYAFGSPRPTMDLVQTQKGIRAFCNKTKKDLSVPVIDYAKQFFDDHPDIDLFIGKDRSPSCGVCSARLYDKNRVLLSDKKAGLMAQEALKRGILAKDAQSYILEKKE